MILTPEQLLIQQTARKFAQERVAPHSAEWEAPGRLPARPVSASWARSALMGMTVPPEWGGAGADNVSYSLALQEIAAGDGALATVVSGHNSVGVMPILSYGTEAQKQRYVRDLASGRKLTAFCLTEPQGGSDAAAIRTQARRQGDQLPAVGHQAVHHQRRHRRHRTGDRRHRSRRGQARHLSLHRRHQDGRLHA